jgi:hypothetical protein
MIRPLRRFHRVAMAVLATALLVLFIVGLLVRPTQQPPNNQRLNLLPAPATPGGLR